MVMFPGALQGVFASIDLMTAVGELNERNITAGVLPIYVRIGLVALGSGLREELSERPLDERDMGGSIKLSEAAHLQKDCPIGHVAVDSAAYDDLGQLQPLFRRAYSPALRDKDAYVSIGRQSMPYSRFLDGLTDEQKNVLPLIHFSSWETLRPDGFSLFDVQESFQDFFVVLGETLRRVDTHHGSAATSDAIGVIEIVSELPAIKHMDAVIDQWEDSADIAGARNILVVGSGLCNVYGFAINDMIDPVRMSKSGGRLFNQLVATGRDPTGKPRRRYFGTRDEYGRHCALVVHCRSPFNTRRRLIWVAGITGRGTQAGLLLVRDLVRDASEVARTSTFPQGFNPVACIVGAPLEAPPHRRVNSYRTLWTADAEGKYLDLFPAQSIDLRAVDAESVEPGER